MRRWRLALRASILFIFLMYQLRRFRIRRIDSQLMRVGKRMMTVQFLLRNGTVNIPEDGPERIINVKRYIWLVGRGR